MSGPLLRRNTAKDFLQQTPAALRKAVLRKEDEANMVEHFKKVAASGMTQYPPNASAKRIAIPHELRARLEVLSQAVPAATSAGKKKASLRVSSAAGKLRSKTLAVQNTARARKPPPITTEEDDAARAASLPSSRRASSLAMRRSLSMESGPLRASALLSSLTLEPSPASPSDAAAKPSTNIKDLWRSVKQEWIRPAGGLTKPTIKRVASFLLKEEAALSPPVPPDSEVPLYKGAPGWEGVGKGAQSGQLGQDALTSLSSWVGVPKTTLSAHARSRAPGSWSPRVRKSEPAGKVAGSDLRSEVATRAGRVVRFQDSQTDSFSPVTVVWGRRVGSAYRGSSPLRKRTTPVSEVPL